MREHGASPTGVFKWVLAAFVGIAVWGVLTWTSDVLAARERKVALRCAKLVELRVGLSIVNPAERRVLEGAGWNDHDLALVDALIFQDRVNTALMEAAERSLGAIADVEDEEDADAVDSVDELLDGIAAAFATGDCKSALAVVNPLRE